MNVYSDVNAVGMISVIIELNKRDDDEDLLNLFLMVHNVMRGYGKIECTKPQKDFVVDILNTLSFGEYSK